MCDDSDLHVDDVAGPEYSPVHFPDPVRWSREDEVLRARWRAKWTPRCPERRHMRVRTAIAHRERNVAELELRVPIGVHEDGVCTVVVEERPAVVYVRVLTCHGDEEREVGPGHDAHVDCPVRVWLDAPLGGRAVIDVDSGAALPVRAVPRAADGAAPSAGGSDDVPGALGDVSSG